MGSKSKLPNNDKTTTIPIRTKKPEVIARYPPTIARRALVTSVSVKYIPHSVPSLFLSICLVKIAIYAGYVKAVDNPNIN